MTLAILFAFASAACLGAGVVTTQFGLRHVEPISGAAISVPAFTLLSPQAALRDWQVTIAGGAPVQVPPGLSECAQPE